MEPSSTVSPAEAEAVRKSEEATRALAARFDAEAEAARVESFDASQLLEWAFEQFGQDIYIACSFQKTSSVVMHLATEMNPEFNGFKRASGLEAASVPGAGGRRIAPRRISPVSH